MVFYDGGFFKLGQLYFKYHEKKGWFSLSQLHSTLEKYIAAKVKTPIESTKIVGSHYYDGRTTTKVADAQSLEKDRDFEMALVKAGITTHYLPLRETLKTMANTAKYTLGQKGVDVHLALDVLDYAHTDRFDVAVLITGDEDFVPLVNRITSLGKQALIAHFDFEAWTSTDAITGKEYKYNACKASRALLDSASFTLNFNNFVNDRDWKTEVNSLFFKN